MKWLNDDDIRRFLRKRNYDIRLSHNARWIDQKCTSDVVTIVSDCILQYAHRCPGGFFTSTDVWHDRYTTENVEAIFKKPNPDEIKARNEYDKFFQQPMEMLAYAGVLLKDKRSARNFYCIAENEILEYLSIRERNALTFLQLYILKVLEDSGIKRIFDDFFVKQTKTAYENTKDGFTNFIIQYTPVNGAVECHRIFTKVINPLAFRLGKRGTEQGKMSHGKITYDMLMYNRDNFRDIYSEKPKELTRRQYADQLGLAPSAGLNAYMSQKAKKLVRAFNDTFRAGMSEIRDGRHDADKAIHIHHIFPEADFPDICAYYENLIALTPTQHLSYAHPLGNTWKVDRAYQHICLLAKANVIQEALCNLSREQIYEFRKFMFVLFVGLDDDSFMQIADGDFMDAISAINIVYAR
ncbi:MAG: restriction endonuclease [Clostridiales Family XIII bacterium]|jgi:hypothetical protein|nr:restriction endonuclease [Clostridiales Family XIII bacterium]